MVCSDYAQECSGYAQECSGYAQEFDVSFDKLLGAVSKRDVVMDFLFHAPEEPIIIHEIESESSSSSSSEDEECVDLDTLMNMIKQQEQDLEAMIYRQEHGDNTEEIVIEEVDLEQLLHINHGVHHEGEVYEIDAEIHTEIHEDNHYHEIDIEAYKESDMEPDIGVILAMIKKQECELQKMISEEQKKRVVDKAFDSLFYALIQRDCVHEELV